MLAGGVSELDRKVRVFEDPLYVLANPPKSWFVAIFILF
jgi:hypothetical protein